MIKTGASSGCDAGYKPPAFFKIGPRQNELLASLPGCDFDRVLPHLEATPMPTGVVFSDSGSKRRHAYFPTTAIVSLQQVLGQGATSEIAVVGRDGMLGIAILIGAGLSSSRSVGHCPGMGYRLNAEFLLDEFEHCEAWRSLLLRYAQVRVAQIAQTSVCYRHHSVEQQVCRRLLMNLDRLISAEIPVTHDLMAGTLGVRREAVTLATCRLQAEGLISCGRGRITILDRRRVESRACECYRALCKETARLMPFNGRRALVA